MSKRLKTLLTVIILTTVTIVTITALTIHFLTINKISNNDVDITSAGENYTIETTDKTINDYTAQECVYACAGKLDGYSSYYAQVSGKVTALGGIYSQNVSGEKFTNSQGSLYISKSQSAFVSVGKQIFIPSSVNDVLIREATDLTNDVWDTNTTNYTYDNFLLEYGTDFRQLTNYIINENTITSANLTNKQDDKYTFTVNLDAQQATIGYRVNMKKMGNLSSLPEFYSCTLELTMDSNFNPITLVCKDEYKVNMLGGLKCSSTITTTFTNINQQIEIPDINFFLNI